MSKIPKGIKVVSILSIILASLTVVSAPFNVYLLYYPLTSNPLLEEMQRDPNYMKITLISLGLSFCTRVILLASAIGSLKLKAWGRTGMNVYAIISLITMVLGLIMSFVYTLPKMLEHVSVERMEAVKFGSIVGIVLSVTISGSLAAAILVVFNRRVAVNAFKGILPDDEARFPGDFTAVPPPLPAVPPSLPTER